MSELLSGVYLARHGETAWSLSGQHTGRTDLPLTERGEGNARALGERLRGLTFVKVLTSPLKRALQTCELAGFGAAAEVDPDLVEWDYGQYEGRRTAEIQICSATAVREENRRSRSARGPTASWAGCRRSKATSRFFRTDISCKCLPPAGSVHGSELGEDRYHTADRSSLGLAHAPSRPHRGPCRGVRHHLPGRSRNEG
jgi:broad specificity phosphatase PhoE